MPAFRSVCPFLSKSLRTFGVIQSGSYDENQRISRLFGQQAFKENPEGVASSQPGASDRRERHPGLPRCVSDTPPKGAKAATEAFLPLLLPPPGAIFLRFGQPGVSLAALACPGLGACNPFGVFLERLLPKARALRFYPLMLEIFAGHQWLTVLVGVGFQQIA